MLSIDELLLQIAFWPKYAYKCVIFIEKLQKKFSLERGVSPPDPLVFGGWRLRPKTFNPQ